MRYAPLWTKEKTQRLIELWATDIKMAEIAQRLGVSKNAIAGKVYRLREDGVDLPRKMLHARWTPTETVIARAGAVAGLSRAEIAEKTGRTKRAVGNKVQTKRRAIEEIRW